MVVLLKGALFGTSEPSQTVGFALRGDPVGLTKKTLSV